MSIMKEGEIATKWTVQLQYIFQIRVSVYVPERCSEQKNFWKYTWRINLHSLPVFEEWSKRYRTMN